jgi:hypothetical protein
MGNALCPGRSRESRESLGKGKKYIEKAVEGICLVTGKPEEISRIHKTIKGSSRCPIQRSGTGIISMPRRLNLMERSKVTMLR